MPLPTLNTQGVDVRNTLATIANLKNAEVQRKLAEEELASKPVVNALRVAQMKQAEVGMEREKKLAAKEALDMEAKSAAYIVGVPEEIQEAAYQDFRTKSGAGYLPESSAFYTEGKWDPLKFRKMSDNWIRARNLQIDDKTGERKQIVVKNEKYDANKPLTPFNTPYVKRWYESKGYGKIIPVVDKNLPDEPMLDEVTKFNLSERRLDIEQDYKERVLELKERKDLSEDERKKALDKAKERRENELLKLRGREVSAKEKEVGLKIAGAQENKLKYISKAESGATVYTFTDGTSMVKGADGKLRPTTAEEEKNLTRISGEEDELTKIMSQRLAESLGIPVNRAEKTTPSTSNASTSNILTEQDARARLTAMGITGPEQDTQINAYKAIGKVK